MTRVFNCLRTTGASLLVLSTCALGSCASIASGTDQQIMVNAYPTQSTCKIEREGMVIASVPATPGSAVVDKNKHHLTIICSYPGFEDASMVSLSGIEPWTFGNFFIGGLIGWGIDSALGADNRYADTVTITLQAQPGSAVLECGLTADPWTAAACQRAINMSRRG